uniref:Uncharacterized protein n=1 Tax=Gossypium raimondii TaxID=29730 RepID=A0A0D2TA49_GOSRA|nr:hypothetical protein B456_009G240300 [Gossypium raimondii]
MNVHGARGNGSYCDVGVYSAGLLLAVGVCLFFWGCTVLLVWALLGLVFGFLAKPKLAYYICNDNDHIVNFLLSMLEITIMKIR